MAQLTFSDLEYSNRKHKTKREQFLEMMDQIIPCDHWVEIIKPYYPSGKRGRPTRGIETMLRMYLMQNWFNLSDEAIEDCIYDSYAKRSFMHIDFLEKQVPDATTLLKFRHLLEREKIGEQIFADVNKRLDDAGLIMHGGTIVDAGSGCIHTITGTAANVHDIDETHNLIRSDDDVVYGDSGYLGIERHDEIKNDEHLKGIEFRINRRPSSLKTPDSYKGINWDKQIEHRKSSVCCKVEHAFLIVKRRFGYCII